MDKSYIYMLRQEQISRYLELVARRTHIILNSGVYWKPEYETEWQQIEKELEELRPLVDAEHKRICADD